VSQDVKFEEDLASRKSHETLPVTEDEEQEALKVESRSSTTSSAEVNLQVRRRRDQPLLVLSGDLDGSCRH
jgi:hypothetical protein